MSVTLRLPVTHTVTTVADVLNCHEDTVYALIKCGRLRAVKLGRKYVVPNEALRAYLAGDE